MISTQLYSIVLNHVFIRPNSSARLLLVSVGRQIRGENDQPLRRIEGGLEEGGGFAVNGKWRVKSNDFKLY